MLQAYTSIDVEPIGCWIDMDVVDEAGPTHSTSNRQERRPVEFGDRSHCGPIHQCDILELKIGNSISNTSFESLRRSLASLHHVGRSHESG